VDVVLHINFTTLDPTTLNRQGPDEGTQYRSAVFFKNEEEKALAAKVIKDVEREKIWPDPIVTTLEPLKEFYSAEDYHQDYFNKFESASELQKMGMNSGYCRAIIEPKVRKFRAKYADKLKK
jgi:methionine-S-sulfoxide reductase